ncbi:tRNA dihydrouridine(20/20a) synthase DusA [Alkaliphilus transvaalensis]|uniref:tRNA dihydrouridine(20/20a) synthase DusA n=1 Tax=Alkaliphilus transvaalensis TaxID=114628 RepID=UPI00047B7E62|nr:tRNA dihydrouridine(20/20a) synthase DusA [Alkaliphilus transvaalensis]
MSAKTRISIAPMVDITDRHFRYFCRLITSKAVLYTEMINSKTIIYGDKKRHLDFDPFEKPVVLQIAGCNKREVAEAVKIAEEWDYDEINLNVGCPSDRVSGNQMGAALMAYPELVAEMVEAMKKESKKPITIKHRIGIDGTNVLSSTLQQVVFNEYEDMERFVKIVSQAGVKHFIVHARIAILEGLSPKENREIPPLRYHEVYRLKEKLPQLIVEINGGVKSIDAINEHLRHVDGVMLGRIAYEDPFMLREIDGLYKESSPLKRSRREIIEALINYVQKIETDLGTSTNLLRNVLGLFANQRGSRKWRQLITPPWPKGYGGAQLLEEALKVLPSDILDDR